MNRAAIFCLALGSSPGGCKSTPVPPAVVDPASTSLQERTFPVPPRSGPAAIKPASAADQTPHDFTVTDLLAMDRLGQATLSPDGRHLAFVQRTADVAGNRFASDLWVVAHDGSSKVRLTHDVAADDSPVWSPDSQSIYFLSNRSGDLQVWRTEIAHPGSPTQITHLELPVANLQLSPRGDFILFSAEVFVDCGDLRCTRRRMEQKSRRGPSGTLHKSLFVRHWDRYGDGRRSHLFALRLGDQVPIDLTRGLDADVPSRPFGGGDEFTVSPDGSTVVFTARAAGREEAWSTNFDLFAVPSGGGPLQNLTLHNPAWDTHPRFSPDGKTLAWLAMDRPGYESDRFVIQVAPWPFERKQQVRALTSEWDASPDSLSFTAQGRSLVVTAPMLGQHALFEVALSDGTVDELVKEGSISDVSSDQEHLYFLRHDLRHPAELYRWSRADGSLTAITHVNDARLAATRMGDPQQFSFAGAGGDRVYGYVVKPANFDPHQRYPVAFLIHGGPQSSFGNMFHYRWNPQTYAGSGFAVVMIDFHGSVGYGQTFVDSIRGDWGGKPLEDLQRGLAHALANHPWMDGDRVCALGASYGGYMVNWIASQWPHRFDCLVNHDGLFDLRMMYFSTDELWFPEWDQRGTYGARGSTHERHNPASWTARWKTPMLVIHGALDYRVPISQGLATFTALQRQGIESAFLVFPDENHWVLRPQNVLQWHEVVTNWLKDHL